MYVAKRQDNTFETLINGMPYHVIDGDPLYAVLAAEYAGLQPGCADVDGVVMEDHRHTAGWINGEPFTMEDFGPLPEGFSMEPPPPSLADLQAMFTAAIQEYMDSFFRQRNYDGVLSAATYATSTNAKFAAEGQYAVEMRDAIWAKGYAIMDAVLAGEREIPSIEEVLSELPALVWPDA